MIDFIISRFYFSSFLIGYRDSQCGWVTSWEETSSSASVPSSHKTVAFLVIYITKRGILEIWTPQQGTRVAAFNCSKGAK